MSACGSGPQPQRWSSARCSRVGAAVLTGCHSAAPPPPSTSVVTDTVTSTLSASTFRPPAADHCRPAAARLARFRRARSSRPARTSPRRRSRIRRPNVADIVGSHVYRTTVLTARGRPAAGSTSTPAVRGGRRHRGPDLRQRPGRAQCDDPYRRGGPGGDRPAEPRAGRAAASRYRTEFYGPDAGRDWACAFAAASIMVVVHTQRTDTAAAAVYLAQAVAGHF